MTYSPRSKKLLLREIIAYNDGNRRLLSLSLARILGAGYVDVFTRVELFDGVLETFSMF